MMKFFGCILVLCGTSMCGFLAVRRLSGRAAFLSSLVAALDLLRSELGWLLKPIPDIYAGIRLEYPELSALFAEYESGAFEESWRSNVCKCPFLAPGEKKCLIELGRALGRYDSSTQERAISAARERLKTSLDSASDKRSRYGRLYGILGIVCGLAIIVLAV